MISLSALLHDLLGQRDAARPASPAGLGGYAVRYLGEGRLERVRDPEKTSPRTTRARFFRAELLERNKYDRRECRKRGKR